MLKTNAPPDLIATLDRLEKTADDCWRTLRIVNNPANVGLWALLTHVVHVIEQRRVQVPPGTGRFDVMLANLSRAEAVALKWASQHGRPAADCIGTFEPTLAQAADQALALGHQYSHFEVCFQGFHKDLYEADLLAGDRVRFTVSGSNRFRQVRAFQQYGQLRPAPVGAGDALPALETQRVRDLMAATANACRAVSLSRFEYDDAWDLWQEMFPLMRARLRVLTRRAGDPSLGPFTLLEFGDVYAAILAIVSAHDHLCFIWGTSGRPYPVGSAVLVRNRTEWLELLSRLSGVSRDKCDAVLGDLSFDARRSTDLHIHPIVPIDAANDVLAIAPPFPMHANHEENILRVCSQRRKPVFDAISGEKESEMLAALRPYLGQLFVRESVALPNGNPNIDLIIADEPSSTVVFAELKWTRKPARALEIPDRDAELLKGVDQLGLIRTFLRSNPRHLSDSRRLPRPLTDYQNVHYLLIARDHWRWADPSDEFATVQFDALTAALTNARDLRQAVHGLLRYEWLPTEGADFSVRFEAATCNGVSLESEIFYLI